jgi:glycosyltransferase involved in cell wall biosynthesis
MPAVSVIIPTRNSAAFVASCLRSVAAQTVKETEIILIDSESADGTHEQALSSGIPFRWVPVPHRGPGAARNRGVQAATAEVIAFLDSDDHWHPNKLQKQLAAMKSASAGAVYCPIFNVEEGKPVVPFVTPLPSGDIAEAVLLDSTIVTTSAFAFRRELWDAAGPFIETSPIREDWEWFVRITCTTTVAVVPEPLVYYRLHAGNTHKRLKENWPNARLMVEECLRAYKQGKGRLPSDVERRVWFNLYQDYGVGYLFSGQSTAAVPFFWNAWQQCPGELKTGAYLIASLLPPSYLAKIQRWRGRV